MKFLLITEPQERVLLPGDLVRPQVSLVSVDWEREAAVIVDLGEQRTGGYRVEVTGVRPGGPGELLLDLKVTRPGPGSFVTQVMTHPYAVARVDRAWLGVGDVTIIGLDESGQEIARQVISR